jgi:chemotaxis protein MotB
MITFSDMVTLLLTFFVMIISITSLEPKSLAVIEDDSQQISEFRPPPRGTGVLGFSNPTLVAPLINLLENQESLPPDVSLDQEQLLAALFRLDPEDLPDYQRLEREIKESVNIFKDERGLVVRWDKSILFPEGSYILREENLLLLDRLSQVLQAISLPISVEGYTDPLSDLEGGKTMAGYRLSANRSKVILEALAGFGLDLNRMRLGAHGGSLPLTQEAGQGRENSRIEIVIYKPTKSSWT